MQKKLPGAFPETDPASRKRYGMIGGFAGIAVNAAIFLMEVFVGFLTGSIAIMADAFHNLTDVVSSVITIISFRLASKPADNEHPFGHGRIEYLSTLVVSFIIMLIGYQFLQSSAQKIMHPSRVVFSVVSLVLILVALPVKILLSLFYRKLARLINSSTLSATSMDALSDVFVLAVASVSLIAAAFTSFPLDGYLGILVALFIMYSGFRIARGALNPLLGEPPDPAIVKEIVSDLLGFRYITGVHDLVIHNYGPGKFMATIHAEVPCDVPVTLLHESIDEAEKTLSEKHDILLVIHMDPVNSDDEEVKASKEELLRAIRPIDSILSVHDFRIVGTGEFKNLIFDVVVNNKKVQTLKDEENLRNEIAHAVRSDHPHYKTVVSVDRNYISI